MKKHFPFISFLIVLIMVVNLFAACTIDTQQNDSTTNGTTTESEAQSDNSENTSETGTFQTTVEDNTNNSDTTGTETTDGETTDGETTEGDTSENGTTECKHTSCTTVAAKPATCTEEGNDAYFVCNDCKAIFDEAGNKIDKIPLIAAMHKKLSYRPTAPDMMDLMPSDSSAIGTGSGADNARIEDGVLKYSVTSTTDSYVTLNLGNASTGNGNVIRLVVNKAIATKDSCTYIRNKGDDSFTSEKSTKIGFQGESSDNKHTYLVYLGNIEGFDGDITDIRLDLGKTVGQTVEIYSIEIFHLDLSDK